MRQLYSSTQADVWYRVIHPLPNDLHGVPYDRQFLPVRLQYLVQGPVSDSSGFSVRTPHGLAILPVFRIETRKLPVQECNDSGALNQDIPWIEVVVCHDNLVPVHDFLKDIAGKFDPVFRFRFFQGLTDPTVDFCLACKWSICITLIVEIVIVAPRVIDAADEGSSPCLSPSLVTRFFPVSETSALCHSVPYTHEFLHL